MIELPENKFSKVLPLYEKASIDFPLIRSVINNKQAGTIWADKKSILSGYDNLFVMPGFIESILRRSAALLTLITILPLKLFSILIFKKIHKALGGKLRISLSAGSALPGVVDKFLSGIGLLVLEGYGMTETSAGIAIRKINKPRQLVLNTNFIEFNIFFCYEFAHLGFAAWIADKSCSPTHQRNRVMTVFLHMRQGHNRHQTSHMETGCCWVKSDIA